MCDRNFEEFKECIFRKDATNATRIGFEREPPLLTYAEELQLVLLLKGTFVAFGKSVEVTELFARQTVIDFCMMMHIPTNTENRIVSNQYLQRLIARHPYLYQVLYPHKSPDISYALLKNQDSSLPSIPDLITKYNEFKTERLRVKSTRRESEKTISKPRKIEARQFPGAKIIDYDESGRVFIRDAETEEPSRDLYFANWFNYRGYPDGHSIYVASPTMTPDVILKIILKKCQMQALYLKYSLQTNIGEDELSAIMSKSHNSVSCKERNSQQYAQYIGLRVTDAAISEVKFMARNFLCSRCALATSTNNIGTDDYATIVEHLKFFTENLQTPQQAHQPMEMFASATTNLLQALTEVFVKHELNYIFTNKELLDIFHIETQNNFYPLDDNRFGINLRAAFPGITSDNARIDGTTAHCVLGLKPLNEKYKEQYNWQYRKYLEPWLTHHQSYNIVLDGRIIPKQQVYNSFTTYVTNQHIPLPTEPRAWKSKLAHFLLTRGAHKTKTSYVNISARISTDAMDVE